MWGKTCVRCVRAKCAQNAKGKTCKSARQSACAACACAVKRGKMRAKRVAKPWGSGAKKNEPKRIKSKKKMNVKM